MQYLVIDISFALGGSLLGFACALGWFRLRSALEAQAQGNQPDNTDVANELERANMAAWQLRDLAHNVSSEVGAHQNLVRSISAELDSIPGGSIDSSGAIAETVSKLLVANDTLRARLADAEEKIQKQAVEIRTQQSEARTDPLTQLANRRALDDALTENHQGFAAHQKPFSLLLFDVDEFKKLNDNHGHLAGDEVLRQLATTLGRSVKTTDLLCRYGGEEFAALLPNTKIDAARISAERIRHSIAELSVDFAGKKLQVTASVGVAEVAPQDDICKLIRRADDCVYAAKAAGRNRSYWHDGGTCHPIQNYAQQAGAAPAAEPADAPTPPTTTKVKVLQELPDSTAFSSELNRRIAESHRLGCSLSLLQLRVRNYRQLVLEYGDAVGMLFLDTVAQLAVNILRDMDLLAKLNDGNLVAMLPGSSEKEAEIVGSRIQRALTQYKIPLSNINLPLELELGATDIYPGDDAGSMMARARHTVGLPATPVAPC